MKTFRLQNLEALPLHDTAALVLKYDNMFNSVIALLRCGHIGDISVKFRRQSRSIVNSGDV